MPQRGDAGFSLILQAIRLQADIAVAAKFPKEGRGYVTPRPLRDPCCNTLRSNDLGAFDIAAAQPVWYIHPTFSDAAHSPIAIRFS